jgi:hypothetical protein
MSPPVDKTPIPGLSTRGFLLLIEEAPQTTQYILLHAVPSQRKSAQKL